MYVERAGQDAWLVVGDDGTVLSGYPTVQGAAAALDALVASSGNAPSVQPLLDGIEQRIARLEAQVAAYTPVVQPLAASAALERLNTALKPPSTTKVSR